jgi:hypothetical protein
MYDTLPRFVIPVTIAPLVHLRVVLPFPLLHATLLVHLWIVLPFPLLATLVPLRMVLPFPLHLVHLLIVLLGYLLIELPFPLLATRKLPVLVGHCRVIFTTFAGHCVNSTSTFIIVNA